MWFPLFWVWIVSLQSWIKIIDLTFDHPIFFYWLFLGCCEWPMVKRWRVPSKIKIWVLTNKFTVVTLFCLQVMEKVCFYTKLNIHISIWICIFQYLSVSSRGSTLSVSSITLPSVFYHQPSYRLEGISDLHCHADYLIPASFHWYLNHFYTITDRICLTV